MNVFYINGFLEIVSLRYMLGFIRTGYLIDSIREDSFLFFLRLVLIGKADTFFGAKLCKTYLVC
jgi:hypothetical protein